MVSLKLKDFDWDLDKELKFVISDKRVLYTLGNALLIALFGIPLNVGIKECNVPAGKTSKYICILSPRRNKESK